MNKPKQSTTKHEDLLSYYPDPHADSRPTPLTEVELVRIQSAVRAVFDITSITRAPSPRIALRFDGTLRTDSERAYQHIDTALAPLGYTPILRDDDGAPVLLVMHGRFAPKPWSVWPNVILLVLTIFSMLSVGAGIEMGQRGMIGPETGVNDIYANLLLGWPYALSLLLILGAHEMGHFITARRHNTPVSWPYFIPFPNFFGTMGALIAQRAPAKNARIAFDIGVAGPLAGMVFAVPILLIGLATSPVQPHPGVPYIIEGNSILYALSKFLVFGRFLPGGGEDVFINQMAQAGWTGLFVTALNLIPVGQLDGGHVLYALFGARARKLYWPIMVGVLALALFVSPAWGLWVLLLFFFGRTHIPPLDTLTQIDPQRRRVALLAFIIFVMVFVPNPLRQVIPGAAQSIPTV